LIIKMNANLQKFFSILSTAIVIISVALAVLLVGVRLIGLQVYTVLSGSMEPEFHTGSLIYVKSVDPAELKENDIITFMLDEDTVATHRIVEILPDAEDPSVLHFQTKGDANTSADGTPVHCRNVIGTPVFSIPLLGYLSAYIQQPPGVYVAIAVGAVLLIFILLPDLFSESKDTRTKNMKRTAAKPADAVHPKPTVPKTPASAATVQRTSQKTAAPGTTVPRTQQKNVSSGTPVPRTVQKTTSPGTRPQQSVSGNRPAVPPTAMQQRTSVTKPTGTPSPGRSQPSSQAKSPPKHN